MKLSDIPSQCKSCVSLRIERVAKGRFTEEAMIEGRRYGNIRGVEIGYIERHLSGVFDIKIFSGIYRTNGFMFSKDLIRVTSEGESSSCSLKAFSYSYAEDGSGHVVKRNPLLVSRGCKRFLKRQGGDR